MMTEEERAALVRLRTAVDVLIEKGFGDGRGHEADEASTEVMRRFGKLPIERARSLRLYDALYAVCATCGGETVAGRAALRVGRRARPRSKVFPRSRGA